MSPRALVAAATLLALAPASRAAWLGYAGNAQHTALSTVPTLALDSIRWSTTVDLTNPAEPIYVHYGSPLVTNANTVIIPVNTTSTAFRLDARSADTGSLLWSTPTDYLTAPSSGTWRPTFAPTLTPAGQLYYQGLGGTVFRVNDPNAPTIAPQAINFLPDYATNQAAYNSTVYISTPITSDSAGNIYFGYEAKAGAPGGLKSGIARITPAGIATYVSADAASGVSGASGFRMGTNSAPAVSADGTKVYVALRSPTGAIGADYLASIDALTLAPIARVSLTHGQMLDQATSSPTIGPDGHVYFGVWRNNNYRGMLEHFSADLSQTFAPASFGWDITPSIVPATLVPSYTGASNYLLLTKYNDYAGFGGGSGDNRMAILDPNATQIDPVTGLAVMKEVLTISGVTPDTNLGGVREWCVNTAAVDPFTKSVLVNSADGWLYRWDLTTNTFTQRIELQTNGALEAYTPTAVGPDGAVYAINRSTLFSVVPEPGSGMLLTLAAMVVGARRGRGSAARGEKKSP